jgi:hypothetical protein
MANNNDTKTNPKKVLEMANNIYPKLSSAENQSVALFKTYKTSATGNKGKAYWNGNRAFKWYCSAVRSCANSHYRIAKMAEVYKKLCSDAMKVQLKDNPGSSVYTDLHTKVIRLGDLKRRAERNYNTVVTWGKS